MDTVLKKYFRDALLEQVNLYGRDATMNQNIGVPAIGKGGGMSEGIGGGGGDS